MAIYTPNFPKLLEPGLRKVFFQEWEMWPEEYSKVFNINTTTKNFEKDITSSGFGAMPVKPEGEDATFQVPYQGYETIYRPTTYALGFKVSREMWEDELYGISRKWSNSLSTSGRQTVEIESANIFNNGFSGSYLGADSKALFALDHPLLGGGTEQNELTTGATSLSIAGLDEARYVMEETVDDRGLLTMVRPKYLIVPPELETTARELLESQYRPATNYGHVKNVLLDYGLELVVLHYLTSATAWFLGGVKHELNFFWRRKIEFGQDNEFATQNALYLASMRFDVGWSEWRGMFGCPGA